MRRPAQYAIAAKCCALGLRAAVDERYERLRALLGERLGLEPDRETRALHRQLLTQG